MMLDGVHEVRGFEGPAGARLIFGLGLSVMAAAGALVYTSAAALLTGRDDDGLTLALILVSVVLAIGFVALMAARPRLRRLASERLGLSGPARPSAALLDAMERAARECGETPPETH